MTRRFICPHCHSPVAPLAMEIASSADAQYRICPECDEAVLLFVAGEEIGEVAAKVAAASTQTPPAALAAESDVR